MQFDLGEKKLKADDSNKNLFITNAKPQTTLK